MTPIPKRSQTNAAGGMHPAQHLIFGDAEQLRSYSHDEVAGLEYARMPEVVVRHRHVATV